MYYCIYLLVYPSITNFKKSLMRLRCVHNYIPFAETYLTGVHIIVIVYDDDLLMGFVCVTHDVIHVDK